MSHLIGTSLLKPYMHGYFVALGLYDKARLLANPTAYADARERAIRARIDKAADSRIRARKHAPAAPNVRVNKDLAERMTKQSEREEKKRENKAAAAAAGEEGADAEAAAAKKNAGVANLLTDARFKELFTNPEFQVDDTSREFAMLNPSTAAKGVSCTLKSGCLFPLADCLCLALLSPVSVQPLRQRKKSPIASPSIPIKKKRAGARMMMGQRRTIAVMQVVSGMLSVLLKLRSNVLTHLGPVDPDLSQYNPRERAQAEWKQAGQHGGPKYQRGDRPRLVEDDDDDGAPTQHAGRGSGRRSAPFEERLRRGAGPGRGRTSTTSDGLAHEFAGERSVSWVPSSSGGASSRSSGGGGRGCDDSGSRGGRGGKAGGPKAKGGESFGMGMSKAGGEEGRGVEGLSEDARFGRTKRRNIGRSASKNAMRK